MTTDLEISGEILDQAVQAAFEDFVSPELHAEGDVVIEELFRGGRAPALLVPYVDFACAVTTRIVETDELKKQLPNNILKRAIDTSFLARAVSTLLLQTDDVQSGYAIRGTLRTTAPSTTNLSRALAEQCQIEDIQNRIGRRHNTFANLVAAPFRDSARVAGGILVAASKSGEPSDAAGIMKRSDSLKFIGGIDKNGMESAIMTMGSPYLENVFLKTDEESGLDFAMLTDEALANIKPFLNPDGGCPAARIPSGHNPGSTIFTDLWNWSADYYLGNRDATL